MTKITKEAVHKSYCMSFLSCMVFPWKGKPSEYPACRMMRKSPAVGPRLVEQ